MNRSIVSVLFLSAMIPAFGAVHNLGDIKEEIGITENLGKQIDTSLSFTNQDGVKVSLEQYFNQKKPVIITPVYYSCSRLCTFVLNGLTNAIKTQEDFLPGKDYTVLTFTINPDEDVDLAMQKRKNYFQGLGEVANQNEKLGDGWQFLTGDEKNIKKLASDLGFRYRRNGNEFEHSASIMVLTPSGQVARYLYGIQYREADFKLALIEASKGEIGSVMNRLILYCFQYDPAKRHYSLIAWNVMKIAASAFAITTIGLLGFLWYPSIRKRMKKSKDNDEITS